MKSDAATFMFNAAAQPVRVGVDIGGTFTDLQIFDARSGRITSSKTLTTPEDPSRGLITGLKEAAVRNRFTLAEIGYLLHGTTIATNAVLEKKLAKGALVTTQRFEDVLEIGRHYRREIYSLNPRVPPLLVPRDRRIGIAERIGADGRIETALTDAALDNLIERLDELDVAAVAICLINAYLNPAHEQRTAEHIATKRPRLKVSCSSNLNAEIREYERTSTTVLNALLIPVIADYLDKLKTRLANEGLCPRLLLVQSNGGVCSPETAAMEPVRLLLSGPSGGAAACALLSHALGQANIVGVDMGGTSFDVCLVRDGNTTLVSEGEIDLMPVRLQMVEIRTIGAGGGSIAQVLPGGRLTVGPESAGSRPGPACYSRGGTEPTVTDANLVLKRLDAKSFLGGDMQLDEEAARRSIEQRVADPLSLSLEAAAEGVIKVVNANLGAAIRLSLFKKGLDPRDFVMIAFGGAAGLHAIAVANELDISQVVFPESASTLSAFGILNSNLMHDIVRSQVLDATLDSLPALQIMTEKLLTDANALLDADAVPAPDRQIDLAADMRYKGQAFEVTVPARSAGMNKDLLCELISDYHDRHRQHFSYANPGSPVEIVSLRVSAVGRLPKPEERGRVLAQGSRKALTTRRVWIDGGWLETTVWNRDQIPADASVDGPAIIEEPYTTILLSDGWNCHRDAGHLVAKRKRQ